MLPKNRLGRQLINKLKVYAGPHHPHAAQQPQPLKIEHARRSAVMPKPLTQTTGRRKEAVARVRLRPGTGKITINRRELDRLLPVAHPPDGRHRAAPGHRRPRRPTTSTPPSTAAASPARPAPSASASPARSSRSTPSCGSQLKKAGFLTRDAREKESKKYGLKKARKAPQYSKR